MNVKAFIKSLSPKDLGKLRKYFQDEKGVTAIEYGLIAAATAVAIILSLNTIKTGLSAIFASIATNI